MARAVEVFQSQRSGDVLRKSIVEVTPRELLIDVARDVEIPIVVKEVLPRQLRAARRRTRRVIAGIGIRKIDTRARGKQIAHPGLPLDRQQTADIVDPELGKRRLEVD